jgi:class 3 adenylate cyclase
MSRNSISIYLSVLSAFAVNFFNREGAKNAKRFFFRLICVSSFIRFLTGGALVLFAFNAPAQDRVFQYSPGAHLTEFMEYCYFLTDSARFNADEPPLDADFISAAKVDFDQLPDRYWMKFSIQNREDRQVNLQLFIGLSEKMFFYVPGSEKYEAYSIGTFESRSIAKQISGVGKTFLSQALVTLEPGQTQTFYAWFHHLSKGVQASRDAKISPLLIDEQIWVKNNNISNTIWDIIFGSFLILILYHFVYYFLTRDSVYLYYCFFVFSAAFPFLTLVRDVADNPAYNALMFFSVSGLFSVFYFQLARKFISLRELLPRWDKILRYYIVGKTAVVALYCILHLFTKDIFVILAIYIPAILLELVLMILLAVALVKTKDRISVIYVVGSSLAWAGILLSIILADPEMNFTPQMKPYHFGMPAYGFVLESLFFAMALAYRAKLNEIEKKQAKDALIKQLQENKTLQEKVNRELEEKVVERTKDIELERQKSEKLLLNVLPQTIVEEMKATGTTIPKRFNNVSVLIADFVGFTAIAEKLSPEELVRRLDHFFKRFDAIAASNGMEKIKTIGDAYMCACGLPDPDPLHAYNAVRTALEFQDFLEEYNQAPGYGEHEWRLRIGIQSGPIVAGVIGDYKFTYDIWGDTVNTASRLEQHSEGARTNVSHDVYELVKDHFSFEKRGTIDVKNKGKVQMYFVTGMK